MVTLTLVPDTGKKKENQIDVKLIDKEHLDSSIEDLLQSAFIIAEKEPIVNCAIILIQENGDYLYNWSNDNMSSSIISSLKRMQEEIEGDKK